MGDRLNTPILSDSIPRMGNKFSCWLGRTVLRGLGWQFSGEFPEGKKMIITVAPHTSNWDFVVGAGVVFALRLKISFFGKHSIFIPPFDRLLRHFGGIPVERSSAHGKVSEMVKQIREADKMIFCLSPEGTRSRIEKWKTGFLHIAQKADVPVFLVAFDYKKKHIEFGPLHEIGDDITLELNKIYSHYASVQAKYPEKVATNLMPIGGEQD